MSVTSKGGSLWGRYWEWAAQSICEWATQASCEWAKQSICEWAKTAILDATQKTPTPIASVALHAQIYFTAWVACARKMMAPTFLVAVDRCRE